MGFLIKNNKWRNELIFFFSVKSNVKIAFNEDIEDHAFEPCTRA